MSYDTLLKRLDALDPKTKSRNYIIDYMTVEGNIKLNCPLFKTPDEALEAVYEDARSHGVEYLHVMLWPWDIVGLRGKFVGYSWRIAKDDPWKIRNEEINHSNIYIWDSYILGGVSPLEYPNPKPEFEVLDHLRFREIYWCNRACKKTVQGWKDSWDDKRRKMNNDKTEVEELEDVYREAGYDLSKFTGWESIPFDEFVTM